MRWTAWRLSGRGCSDWDGTQFVLTSNKHVRDWPTVFADDEILTTAILDRLLHHVQVLHIDGRSYRLREPGGDCPRGSARPIWSVRSVGLGAPAARVMSAEIVSRTATRPSS